MDIVPDSVLSIVSNVLGSGQMNDTFLDLRGNQSQ